MTTHELPPIPVAPERVLVAHEAAHDRWAATIAGADPVVSTLFGHLQMRLLIESAANVTPIVPVTGHAPFPPRRRMLAPVHLDRLAGCRMGVRHLDVRATMRRSGHIGPLFDAETPMVVNALVESAQPADRETNPGLPRATPSNFDPSESSFLPPPSDSVRALLLDATEVVNAAPVPPIVRAAWYAVTLFAVHPFVDGNGRTTRLLFHAALGDGLPIGFDWATIEQWSVHRRAYVDAIKRTQVGATYRGPSIDASWFLEFAVASSIAGAELCVERVELLDRFVDRCRVAGMSDEMLLVYGAIAVDRNVHAEDLHVLPGDADGHRAAIHELRIGGRIEHDRSSGWNPTDPSVLLR
jgi:hypothetical protein